MREHPVNEMGGGVGHASPGARWAKASTLAGESNQAVIAAVLTTAHAHKPIREHAASEIGVELAANEFRQVAAGQFATRVEGLNLAPKHAVQNAFFWLSPRVCSGFLGVDGAGTSMKLASDSGSNKTGTSRLCRRCNETLRCPRIGHLRHYKPMPLAALSLNSSPSRM